MIFKCTDTYRALARHIHTGIMGWECRDHSTSRGTVWVQVWVKSRRNYRPGTGDHRAAVTTVQPVPPQWCLNKFHAGER